MIAKLPLDPVTVVLATVVTVGSAFTAWFVFDCAWRNLTCQHACELAHGEHGACLWFLDRDLCLCGAGDDRQVICLDDDGCTGVAK